MFLKYHNHSVLFSLADKLKNAWIKSWFFQAFQKDDDLNLGQGFFNKFFLRIQGLIVAKEKPLLFRIKNFTLKDWLRTVSFFLLGTIITAYLGHFNLLKFLIALAAFLLFLLSLINFNLGVLLLVFLMPAEQALGAINIGDFQLTFFKILGLAVFLGWLYCLLAGKTRLKLDKLGLAFLFFVIANLLSAVFSDYPLVSISHLSTFVFFFVLYLVLLGSLDDFKFLRKIIYALIVAGIISSFFAFLQYFSLINFGLIDLTEAKEIRPTALMSDPNELGIFLISLLPFCFYWAIEEKSKIKKYLLAASFLIMALAGFLTFSRSVWVIAFLIIFLLFLKNAKRKRVIIAIALTLILLSWSLYPTFALRFERRALDWGLETRIRLANDALDAFRSSPITGVGTGAIRFYNYKDAVTHNAYLQLLAETGILGFLFFLIIVYFAFRNLWVVKLKNPDIGDETKKSRFIFAESLQLALIGYLLVDLLMSFLPSKIWWLFVCLTSVLRSVDSEKLSKC